MIQVNSEGSYLKFYLFNLNICIHKISVFRSWKIFIKINPIEKRLTSEETILKYIKELNIMLFSLNFYKKRIFNSIIKLIR